MKTLTRADLDRSLRESISPLYLLLGSESYLRDTAAQAIADTAIIPQDELDGKNGESSGQTHFHRKWQSGLIRSSERPYIRHNRLVRNHSSLPAASSEQKHTAC